MEKFYRESKELFEAILSLNTDKECEAFFEDLCTIKEIQDLSQRFQVAKMLNEKKNYQDISKTTGASTATISRVNKCLMYGKGGYRTALNKKQAEGKDAQ